MLTVILVLLALAFLAIGVVSVAYQHTAHRLAPNACNVAPEYSLHFVEADDEGWLWDPRQAADALEAVRASAAAHDTFVIVFVHGWHHSAACCDDNVEGFKETLLRLHAELSQPLYRAASGSGGQVQLQGIYIGWRGRSLPGCLDYFTFWGRKAAAERVGRTDLREFLARINHLYRNHNGLDGSPGTAVQANVPYLGLITIGHSFGGDVVLRATAATLEDELEQINPSTGYLRGSRPADPRVPVDPVRGFGDIVILINPAVEAAAYQRLHVLSQGLSFDQRQTPLMLTLSAENDWPRHSWFTIGRRLGEWFGRKPRKPDPVERALERTALGVYGDRGAQITHRLRPLDDSMRLRPHAIQHEREDFCARRSRWRADGECRTTWYSWRSKPARDKEEVDSLYWGNEVASSPDIEELVPGLLVHDFATRTVFGGVALEPDAGAIPFQPMIVATASAAVIDGHNGIFTTPFINFLIRYVGLIEAKAFLLTKYRAKPPPQAQL